MGDFLLRYRNYIALGITGLIYYIVQYHIGHFYIDKHFAEIRKDLYVALSTIFGALLGFAITAFSIVIAMSETVVIQRLQERGRAKKLFNSFGLAIATLAVATLISIAALIFDADKDAHNLWCEYFTLGATLVAAANVIAVIALLQTLTEALLNSAQSPPR